MTVTTPGGTSNPLSFFYVGAPFKAALSPVFGVTAGGDTVTITGTGLSTATAVAFGANSATPTVVNDGTLTVTVPAGAAAGPVGVSVTTAGGATRPKRLTKALESFRSPRRSRSGAVQRVRGFSSRRHRGTAWAVTGVRSLPASVCGSVACRSARTRSWWRGWILRPGPGSRSSTRRACPSGGLVELGAGLFWAMSRRQGPRRTRIRYAAFFGLGNAMDRLDGIELPVARPSQSDPWSSGSLPRLERSLRSRWAVSRRNDRVSRTRRSRPVASPGRARSPCRREGPRKRSPGSCQAGRRAAGGGLGCTGTPTR